MNDVSVLIYLLKKIDEDEKIDLNENTFLSMLLHIWQMIVLLEKIISKI